jgi:hypothetical protein
MNAACTSLPSVKPFRAAAAAAWLSLLFLGVYGFCNWFTSTRSDVGTLYFEWERHIPFIPLMIVPYMSIDLFFIAAPFLCCDADELRVLTRRISMGIIIAGICFLVFPLRFAFDRSSADASFQSGRAKATVAGFGGQSNVATRTCRQPCAAGFVRTPAPSTPIRAVAGLCAVPRPSRIQSPSADGP